MKHALPELKELIIHNLQENNNLKNEVEKKELEKQEQIKAISLSIIGVGSSIFFEYFS